MKRIFAMLAMLLMTLLSASSMAEEIQPRHPVGDVVTFDVSEFIPRGGYLQYTCPDGTEFLTGVNIDFTVYPDEGKTVSSVDVSILPDWTKQYQGCYVTDSVELSYTFYEPGNYRIFVIYSDGSYNYTDAIMIGTDDTHPDYAANKVSEIVAQCKKECTDGGDYAYALWLHDYLATHTYYDSTLAHYSAGYLLEKGYGVCQSYAETYRKLLRACNITSDIVASDETMDHEWNAVKLDGEWYMTDVTWDTFGYNPAGTEDAVVDYCRHRYFALPQCVISCDHYGYEDSWTCTSTADNYYYKNGFSKSITDLLETDIVTGLDEEDHSFSLDLTSIFENDDSPYLQATCEYVSGSDGQTHIYPMDIGLGAELVARYLNGTTRTNTAGQELVLTASHQACETGSSSADGTVYPTVQVNAAVVTSGTCGDPDDNEGKNVTWALDTDTGTLTISGTGATASYTAENPAPWHDSSNGILKVVIGEGVTSIGSYAFNGCSSMTSVSFPSSLEEISEGAFDGCTSITDVYYDGSETAWGNLMTSSDVNDVLHGDNITWHYSSASEELTSGTCGDPDDNEGKNVTWALDTDAGTLTISGTGAMASYTAGTAPWNASLESIETVNISEGVTSVGANAFAGMTSLMYLNMHDITSFGDNAFSGCDLFATVYFGTPENAALLLKNFGEGNQEAFEAKGILQDNVGTGITWEYDYDSGADEYTLIISKNGTDGSEMVDFAKPFVAPWSGNGQLVSVNVGEGITKIGANAFAGLANLTQVSMDCVTSIGENAFEGCTSLAKVTYAGTQAQWTAMKTEGSISTTGNDALLNLDFADSADEDGVYCEGGTGDEETAASGTCGDPSVNEGKNVTWALKNGTLTISGTGDMAEYAGTSSVPWASYKDSITAVSIGSGVTSIAPYAFINCSSLTSVEIPAGVTKIGKCAFSGCSGLTNIALPSGLETIEDYAFKSCTSLTGIEIPSSVTTMGIELFNNCAALKNVVLPSGITSISNYTFYYCTSLENITIPESVTFIGSHAFADCSSLKEINIPSNVTGISDWAFSDCGSLKTIEIPSGITHIATRTFYGCVSLESIVLPGSIVGIQTYAFNACFSLTSIQYNAPEGNWENISIGQYNPGLENVTITYSSHAEKSLVAEVPATCTQTGMKAYYECSYCHAKFDADNQDQQITDESTLVIAATNHAGKAETAAVAATCTKPGNSYYFYCPACEKYFDSAAEEIDEDSWIIPAKGHTEVTDPRVEPTCLKTGLTEGSHCSACDKVFVAQESIPATHIHHLQKNGKCSGCNKAYATSLRNSLILPTGLTSLKASSFKGIAANYVFLPKAMESVIAEDGLKETDIFTSQDKDGNGITIEFIYTYK